MPAQTPQPAANPQAPPTIGPRAAPELRRLAFLVGRWEETITYADSEGGSSQGKGQWIARPQLGHYLFINYQSLRSGGPYRAHGVLSYDAQAQLYRLFWFDNAGGVAEYRGNFIGDALVMEYRGQVGGQAYRERIRYAPVSADVVQTQVDQAWEAAAYQPYLQAVAHRIEQGGASQKPAAPAPPAQR